MRFTRRPLVIATIAALGLTLVPASSATAADVDPPNTITLTTANTHTVRTYTVVGVSSSHALVQESLTGLVAVPKAGGADVVITKDGIVLTQDNGTPSINGDYVWTISNDQFLFQNITNPSDSGLLPETWWYALNGEAHYPAPGGAVFLHQVGTQVNLVSQTYAQRNTTTVTTLATMPAGTLVTDKLLVGPDGVALIHNKTPDGTVVSYVPFVSPHVVAVSTPAHSVLTCKAISSTAMTCANKTTATLWRLSFTGAAASELANASSSVHYAMTETATAWTSLAGPAGAQYHRIRIKPNNSNTTTVTPSTVDLTGGDIFADAAYFYVSRVGPLGEAGAWKVAQDATLTPVAVAPLVPVATYGIVASPGRVTWFEGPGNPRPLKYRTLSNGASLTAGPATLLASSTGSAVASVSGRRTLWSTKTGVLTLSTNTTTSTPGASGGIVTLSGTRLLYVRSSDGHYVVYNIKTKGSLDVSKTYNTRQQGSTVDLWGNSLVYSDKTFNIWRKDLSSSAKPVLVSKAPTPPDGYQRIRLQLFGDWLAYWRSYGLTDDTTTLCGTRNIRTMSTPTTTCSDYATPAGMLNQDSYYGGWSLTPWGHTTPIVLPLPDHSFVASIDGPNVAWAGWDTRGKVSPLLTDLPDQPRSLGNPLTPSSIVRGHSWYLDLVTSAVLTSCSVRITAANGHVVRTLPCGADDAAVGEITTHWDGKYVSGTVVPKGTYDWTVSAGNADGSLLRSDGATAVTHGSIIVA